MTLKEAIEHCKDIFASCESEECATQHLELLDFLVELEERRKKDNENKKRFS